MTNFRLFINGELRDSGDGRRTPLVNPATDEMFSEAAAGTPADASEAIEGAARAFANDWRDLAPGKRADVLYALAALIRKSAEDLALLETRNIGKPISDSRDEIALGARVFEYYAGAVTRSYGQTIPVARGGLDLTLRQPMGVVVAIVPWNFPFPIACWKVAPALAAGNTVVLKPARCSPLTAVRLGELAMEAGLPSGALQVITGSGEALGDVLVTHPLVQKISFTGSTEIGVEIMRKAAAGLKRVSLELGGKSPNIIFADADLEAAARSAPMSVFANAGQDCCARSRIFVERKAMDRFLEEFVKATSALVVGDPSQSATQVGPLISQQHRSGVENFLEEARKGGRTVVCGGDRVEPRGAFLRPAIVMGCETEDRIWREEVFGPVACVRAFDDELKMIDEVNASPYGLSGSIWTNDLKRALRVARRVESGVLSVNSHSSVHVEAPFGGFKKSGIGRDLGMAAMEGYTELKNVYFAD